MFTRNSVTVITPTIGSSYLERCVRSVQEQTLEAVEHFVVPDGFEHREKVHRVVNSLGNVQKNICTMPLPYPTGRFGWNGHRIYAAVSILSNCEFVCFLDDDNWFEPDHIESLVAQVKSEDAAWGFSLRRIFDRSGKFVALDECESLGTLHTVVNDDKARFIDTNCFLLRREVAVAAAPAWYGPAPPYGLGGDRVVAQYLLDRYERSCCTRKYTVNYTVGSHGGSAIEGFFLSGNEIMHKRYPQGLPWEVRESQSV